MVIIYHNPACGTSRKVLRMLRDDGVEPQVIEYLTTPPDAATLRELLAMMAMPARALLRTKEPAYRELGLEDPALGEDQLIAAMVAHPILIARPIVRTERGARLCRPPEAAREILPDPAV